MEKCFRIVVEMYSFLTPVQVQGRDLCGIPLYGGNVQGIIIVVRGRESLRVFPTYSSFYFGYGRTRLLSLTFIK